MSISSELCIAGRKTAHDWEILRHTLVSGYDEGAWDVAFKEFFEARLYTRYFDPIKKIEELKRYDGEGFSIVTIHCSIIEFLGATLAGKTFRLRRSNESPLDDHEYGASGKMFQDFLCERQPFCERFDRPTAKDFYSSVRCGLLHEARTKNGWRIQIGDSKAGPVDVENKIVWRNNMQPAFIEFCSQYRKQLSEHALMRDAFIRKFDSLCEP